MITVIKMPKFYTKFKFKIYGGASGSELEPPTP